MNMIDTNTIRHGLKLLTRGCAVMLVNMLVNLAVAHRFVNAFVHNSGGNVTVINVVVFVPLVLFGLGAVASVFFVKSFEVFSRVESLNIVVIRRIDYPLALSNLPLAIMLSLIYYPSPIATMYVLISSQPMSTFSQLSVIDIVCFVILMASTIMLGAFIITFLVEIYKLRKVLGTPWAISAIMSITSGIITTIFVNTEIGYILQAIGFTTLLIASHRYFTKQT